MSELKIQPLSNRVFIKPIIEKQVTPSGLILITKETPIPVTGTVVAVGKGSKDKPTSLKVGDVVRYGENSGSEVYIEGHEYIMMRETDILLVY